MRQGIVAVAVIVCAMVALPALIWAWMYGPAHLRKLAGPPETAFPNSIAEIDGEGVLEWWGCMRLAGADVREVGSYRWRALLFVPNGSCEIRNPELVDADQHLYVSWRIGLPDEPFGGLWFISPNKCPTQISDSARSEAVQMLKQYLALSQRDDRYEQPTRAALGKLLETKSTSPVDHKQLQGVVVLPLFPSGIWGPARKRGGYVVCASDD